MPPRGSSSKPPSKAAASKPVSRRGAPKSTTNGAHTPIVEDHKPAAAPESSKINGTEAKHINGDSSKAAPALKRGRVGELAEGEKRAVRRRSSVGLTSALSIPQIPATRDPHLSLFVFGTGDNGQFGLGPDNLDEIPRPKIHEWFEEKVEDGEMSRDGKEGSGGLEAVACGGMHTLAIDEAGRVRSWGINDNAALGRKTTDIPDPSDPSSMIPNEDLEAYPLPIESLEKEGFRAVQVAAGDSVSVALSDKGELRAWGSFRSNEGLLGFDGVPGHDRLQFRPIALHNLNKAKIVSVACGTDHVLALSTTGHVYTWGDGGQHQLGRRIIERRKINGLEPERLGLRGIVYVAAGAWHSFAVNSEGVVWAWGLNGNRQCGLSADRPEADSENVTVPTQIDALHPDLHDGARVVSISGGEHYSLFLFDNGELWACGRNDAHELGIAADHPAQDGVKERSQVLIKEKEANVVAKQKKVDSLAKSEDEEAKEAAQMELLEAQAILRVPLVEYVPEPVRVYFPPIPESYEVVPDFPPSSSPASNPIATISAGTRHNLAVSRSGHVYAWGLGNQAQLGLGADTESADVPTLVRSKSLRPYKAVYASAGGQHCVLLAHKADA